MPRKIVIVGPESTGKSTLSAQLAKEYQTNWVPEYARIYLESLERPYTEKDLLEIAKGQLKLEDDLCKQTTGILFFDTNLLVIKVWSEFKYNRLDSWIKEQIEHRFYDYYLLTQVDFPWQPDPLREHPDKREFFFNIYRELLSSMNVPFEVISGNLAVRLKQAKNVVNNLL